MKHGAVHGAEVTLTFTPTPHLMFNLPEANIKFSLDILSFIFYICICESTILRLFLQFLESILGFINYDYECMLFSCGLLLLWFTRLLLAPQQFADYVCGSSQSPRSSYFCGVVEKSNCTSCMKTFCLSSKRLLLHGSEVKCLHTR